jgi:hypothetical protein
MLQSAAADVSSLEICYQWRLLLVFGRLVVRKMFSLAPLLAYDPIHFLIFGEEGERKRMAARLQPCDTPVAARRVCLSTPNLTN